MAALQVNAKSGGGRHGNFLADLQVATSSNGLVFIMDLVQTAGGPSATMPSRPHLSGNLLDERHTEGQRCFASFVGDSNGDGVQSLSLAAVWGKPMSNEVQPLWQLLEGCARALTEAGNTPFTRGDLIECVKQRTPVANRDSLSSVIQGITDNLRGGAPGATGKDILHSVGRGQFVLRTETAEDEIKSSCGGLVLDSSRTWEGLTAACSPAMPENEEGLRDEILKLLQQRLRDAGCVAEAEGTVTYQLHDGTMLSHDSDILIFRPGFGKQVSIELKYKSAVTDQFKCRSYDAAHMKEQHGESILTIMVFARADSGISIERARSICHPFDRFYGVSAPRLLDTGGIDELVAEIRQFLF